MRKLLFFHPPWCPPCRFYEKKFIALRRPPPGRPFYHKKYCMYKLPTVVLPTRTAVKTNHAGVIDVNEVADWLKGKKAGMRLWYGGQQTLLYRKV